MLLNAVILILREVLEAALLTSIMLSLSHCFKIDLSWLKWSVGWGLLGAILYANNIVFISNQLEGVGQEVLNAMLQYVIYLLLAFCCIVIVKKNTLTRSFLLLITWVMGVSISLSMVRELSEIIIYLHVFPIHSNSFGSVMIGAFLGAGIGLSVGVIFHHGLNYLSGKYAMGIIAILLSFISGGMVSQATQLLIQADWLPSGYPLWDSSGWISERSVVGQLLYAVLGYEATPSWIQVVFYLTGLSLILFFVLGQVWKNHYKFKL